MIFNDMFLQQIQAVIFKLREAVPDVKIYFSDTSEKSKEALDQISLVNLKENEPRYDDQDLFLIKNIDSQSFQKVNFDKYFSNQNSIYSYYQTIKIIPFSQRKHLEVYLQTGINSEQTMILGVLSKDDYLLKNHLHN